MVRHGAVVGRWHWSALAISFEDGIEASLKFGVPLGIDLGLVNPPAYLNLAAALAQLGRLDEARSAVKAGLALNPAYTVSRRRTSWTAQSDEPTYLAQLEPICDGLRKAGVPEQ